jgi:putative Mn2+ efflux pump MntP
VSIFELLLIAIGLSADAFAIAIVSGLGMKRFTWTKALIVGLYFGVAQGVMPRIGYFAGKYFADMIEAYDHWVASALLAIIGGKMIFEGLRKREAERKETSLKPKVMLPLAVADSIDALAVGVTFAFLDIEVFSASALICVVTLVISMAGVRIGNLFGSKLKSTSEVIGGVILVMIGLKTLLEHLGVITL